MSKKSVKAGILSGIVCLWAVMFCSSCAHTQQRPTTAILGAFDEETIMLEGQLEDKQEYKIQGVKFVWGRLKGRDVVVGWTGIGKVNAAMTTTLVLERFEPNEVIFSGIAGSLNPELSAGDIVVATKTIQHDLGILTPSGIENIGFVNPVTGKDNPAYFDADPQLLEAAEQAAKQVVLEKIKTGSEERDPRIKKGVIVTGDVFVSSSEKSAELHDKFGADAVEMEGAATAQICYQQNVPCIVIRSISDRSDEKAMEEMNRFLKTAAKNSASFVAEMVGCLEVKSAVKVEVKHETAPQAKKVRRKR